MPHREQSIINTANILRYCHNNIQKVLQHKALHPEAYYLFSSINGNIKVVTIAGSKEESESPTFLFQSQDMEFESPADKTLAVFYIKSENFTAAETAAIKIYEAK